jgi:hypothetical protein
MRKTVQKLDQHEWADCIGKAIGYPCIALGHPTSMKRLVAGSPRNDIRVGKKAHGREPNLSGGTQLHIIAQHDDECDLRSPGEVDDEFEERLIS